MTYNGIPTIIGTRYVILKKKFITIYFYRQN